MDNINIEAIKKQLINNFDVRYREIECEKGIIYIIYVENLCNQRYISEFVISPLIRNLDKCNDFEKMRTQVIESTQALELASVEDAINKILSANVIVLFSFLNRALYSEAKGFVKRAMDIPITETVIKGPREGFTENLMDNLSAIRRRIVNANLKVEQITLGSESKTAVAMLYIEGVTSQDLIDYVRSTIDKVDENTRSGYIFNSNAIEEELTSKSSPFDTIGYTEKADIAASKLSEGRVIIIVNGTPFIITAPYFFIENFQASDDYTLNKYMGNLGRILRWVSFIIATLVPGMYLALVTYHFRLVPTTYVFRMAIYRASVPVPTVVELIYMTLFFQIIREAGVRLPQPIGPTLSIVGALILGDAAVQSGLSSQVTVVVVAFNSVTSYLLPKMHAALFLWNLIMITFSGFLGLPGFFMGFIVFVAHLSNLTSCGYPYLYPLGTLTRFKYKDVILRGNLNRISYKIFIKDDAK
jgi:hypothetical protein